MRSGFEVISLPFFGIHSLKPASVWFTSSEVAHNLTISANGCDFTSPRSSEFSADGCDNPWTVLNMGMD